MTSDAASTSPAPDADTGQVRVVAGRYQLRRAIGQGGMGVVYEAENTWTGRRVALKVLDPGRMADPVQVRRFMQEARAAATLHHPNVVDVLDMGQDPADGSLFIVHELLEGEDLRATLAREKRLDVGRALALLTPALRGLAAAHAAGIVHRDVKPANLFIARGADGATVPKVIDFGIAKDLAHDASQARTSTGEAVGTPAYMAPEQLRGERSMAPPTDVWAVGVVLHEMLSGATPFPSDNYNVLVHRVLSGERPPLDATLGHVPASLRAVIDRCLDPDPSRRYASASALLDALSDAPAPSVAPAAPVRPRRRLAALAVVALSALALAVTLRRPHAPVTPSPRPAPAPRAPSPAAPLVVPVAPSAPAVVALPVSRDASVERAPVERAHGRHPRAATPAGPVDASVRPRTPGSLLLPGGAYPSQ